MSLIPVHSSHPEKPFGDKGDDVASLRLAQRLLNEVASLNLPIRGEADGRTTKALRWYQRTRGLKATGTVDEATLRALTAESGPGCSDSSTPDPITEKATPKTVCSSAKTGPGPHGPTWLPDKALWAKSSSAGTDRALRTRSARDPESAASPEDADTLENHVALLQDRYGIPRPLGNGPDGWRARSNGISRRIGLTRRVGGRFRPLVQGMLDRLDPDSTHGPSLRQSLQHQLSALSDVDPRLDPSLVLAVAMREGGSHVVSTNRSRIHTYYSGGLDFLGDALARGGLTLPAGYGSRWTPERADESNVNEQGRPRRAALIPRNEAIVAYGLVVGERRRIFERHARDILGADAERLLASLSVAARRAWIQISFGGPYGARFQPGRSYGRAFGVRTALGMLQHEIQQGRATGLDDVLHNPALRRYTRVRRAIVTAAEAELLDRSHIARV